MISMTVALSNWKKKTGRIRNSFSKYSNFIFYFTLNLFANVKKTMTYIGGAVD